MRRPLRLGGYPYHLASDRQLHLGGPRLLRSYVRAIAALEETGPLTAGAWESARERRHDVRSRCGVRPVTGRDTETDPPPRAKDDRGPRRLRRLPSDLPHSKLPGGRVPGRDHVLNRVSASPRLAKCARSTHRSASGCRCWTTKAVVRWSTDRRAATPRAKSKRLVPASAHIDSLCLGAGLSDLGRRATSVYASVRT